jgi:hypothetical protein
MSSFLWKIFVIILVESGIFFKHREVNLNECACLATARCIVSQWQWTENSIDADKTMAFTIIVDIAGNYRIDFSHPTVRSNYYSNASVLVERVFQISFSNGIRRIIQSMALHKTVQFAIILDNKVGPCCRDFV